MENIGRWAMAIALPGIMAACFGCTRKDTGDERDGLSVDHPEKVSDETDRRVRTLEESITQELRRLGDHAWAGRFYEGDGMGENVTLFIAPEAGFLFEWHGCMGLYDRNLGSARQQDGIVRLTCDFPNVRRGFRGIAGSFLPIRWGSRLYLVAQDKLVEFCNGVNSGAEPRDDMYGDFLLRWEDWEKPAEGSPGIPESHRSYLLGMPIMSRISAVGASRLECAGERRLYEVTIEAGSAEGVRPGMVFYVTDRKASVLWATVRDVEEHSCMAELDRSGEKRDILPSVGWGVSTRAPWHSKGD